MGYTSILIYISIWWSMLVNTVSFQICRIRHQVWIFKNEICFLHLFFKETDHLKWRCSQVSLCIIMHQYNNELVQWPLQHRIYNFFKVFTYFLIFLSRTLNDELLTYPIVRLYNLFKLIMSLSQCLKCIDSRMLLTWTLSLAVNWYSTSKRYVMKFLNSL